MENIFDKYPHFDSIDFYSTVTFYIHAFRHYLKHACVITKSNKYEQQGIHCTLLMNLKNQNVEDLLPCSNIINLR